jgi:hypothetical protein
MVGEILFFTSLAKQYLPHRLSTLRKGDGKLTLIPVSFHIVNGFSNR